MAKTYNRLEIDVNRKPTDIITAVQADSNSRYLDVSMFNNGVPLDLTGHEVKIFMKKPENGGEIWNDGVITDAKKGRCEFLMTSEALARMGHLQTQVSIWKENTEILSTQVFEINVTKTLLGESSVESSNEYGTLVLLFQNLYEAHALMTDMVSAFGSKGAVANARNIATFWQGVEYLAKYMDTDLRGKLDDAIAKSGGGGDTVILALLSDDTALNEWAFRQNGIGKVINDAFALGSTALAACSTVAAIAASSTAISAIGTNREAVRICAKNKTLATALMSYMTDEEILAAGLGYQKYSVGQEVTLNWYGNPTTFIVTHKGYLTSGKIVLHSKGFLGGHIWAAGANSNYNNYSASGLRTYLNTTVLAGFSESIQAAITQAAVACHDNTTAVTCYDKIWALSFEEARLGTSSYAPVEGSALSYFTSADRRKKSGRWWLRTPNTAGNNGAWSVNADGAAYNDSTTGEYGVVPAFEI